MGFKLQAYMDTRIPLLLRKRKGTIYFQSQFDVARSDGLRATRYLEFAKIDSSKSLEEIGEMTIRLLKRFKDFSDLTEEQFFELTKMTIAENEEKQRKEIWKYMEAKDSKDLSVNSIESSVRYNIINSTYEFTLSWMYKEGRRYYNDSSPSTGEPGVLTFKEPLTFKDDVAPEELGRMVLEALDRSQKIAEVMSGDFCPTKSLELLDGTTLTVEMPKDKNFADEDDCGVGELYQVYSYYPKEGEESPAYFYVGIGAEIDCDTSPEGIRKGWEKKFGEAESFEVSEGTYGIFNVRAEMRSKKLHRISYFLKQAEDLVLECGMRVEQSGRRKRLDEKLSELFEEFAVKCRF